LQALKKIIDQQLKANSHINLFNDNAAEAFVYNIQLRNHSLQALNENERDELVNYTTEQALKTCFGVNQYYRFSKEAVLELKQIYRSVFNLNYLTQEDAMRKHAQNIQQWIRKYQPAYSRYFEKQDETLPEAVPCFEYTPELQIGLLGIELRQLKQPVLDIGCGENAHLVLFLKDKGIDVQGIDRLCTESDIAHCTDWLDYRYEPASWGSIISHLSFTNHFRHQHIQADGNHEAYARKYMEIIHSLKPGGSFYYSPGLEFIESYLPPELYGISTHQTGIDGFNATIVTRLT
jgi:hypothetical protein